MSLLVSRIPNGPQTFKYVMRQNPPAPVHFTATSGTQTTTIVGLPANHVVVGVRVQLVTRFTAVGLSSCLVTVGANDGVNSSANWYAPSFECVQNPSTTTFKYWSPFTTYTTAAHNITATFTATGAQLAAMTAGEIEFNILYRPL